MNIKRTGLALAATLLMQGVAQAQVPGFSLTILNAGQPYGYDTYVSGINDLGQVAGWVQTGLDTLNTRGVLWRSGVAYDLGVHTLATGINNWGQVSGDDTSLTGYFYATAMVWNSATPTRLDSGSSAKAINDAGQVVGTAYHYQDDHAGDLERAVRWDGTTAHVLNSPVGYTPTSATSINNAGQVVGGAYTSVCGSRRDMACWPPKQQHATLWNGDQPLDLGTLGGDASLALDINNAGQVIGTAQTADGQTHAALWGPDAAVQDLGAWRPEAINDAGLIVGTSDLGESGKTFAAVWDGHQLLDLNALTNLYQGWYLTSALDINNVGQVIGTAYNVVTGDTQPFLLSLTSVPEPSTSVMMLLGCSALVAGASRRRARATSAA